MRARRILVAEDNANDAELTLSALAEVRLANQVDLVRDGAEALDYLFRRGRWAERPDELPAVLLLDLKMPLVDGFEVLRQVRADERLRRLPVVVLTSSREERDLAQSYDLGVNSYVVKPVKFDEFARTVSQLGCYWVLQNELPPAAG